MDKIIFKAYDIRGKYPSEIDEDAVFEIAKAVGRYFGKNKHIIVGRDARVSSDSLYKKSIAGLRSSDKKMEIREAGLMTTPMLYFLVNHFDADGGLMVTASHNPKEFNGLKVVGRNAVPISGEEIKDMVNG